MKQLLFSVICCFAFLPLQAQLEDGSIAPDFTVTDINGNVHSLSAYLAEGKTVIMDISATWCSPCWEYHKSGALETLYRTYGKGGSDEVVVLFVEGDSSTPVQSLYGISDVNDTWGNWIEHSSFPVIDNAALGQLYDINYFPTIFRICPDGIVNEIEQLDGDEIAANINTNCETINGLQHHAILTIEDQLVCEGGTVMPKFTIENYGLQSITSAIIELRHNEDVVAVKNFSGDVEVHEDAMIQFDAVQFAPNSVYKAIVTAINGELPQNTIATRMDFIANEALVSNNNITVKVYTDRYPAEISWAIKDSNGNVAAAGGPYEPGTDDNFGGGGPDAHTTKVHDIILEGGVNECYSVELYDTYGDGWFVGDTRHGLEVLSGGETIFDLKIENFGTSLIAAPAFKGNGVLGNAQIGKKVFALYPNPSSGIITITTDEKVNITVTDMSGKVVYKGENYEDGSSINLSVLQKGFYIAQLSHGHITTTQKIIIE